MKIHIGTKPIRWENNKTKTYDSQYGFKIISFIDGSDKLYKSSWNGKIIGDYNSLEDAKISCQEELDRWVDENIIIWDILRF